MKTLFQDHCSNASIHHFHYAILALLSIPPFIPPSIQHTFVICASTIYSFINASNLPPRSKIPQYKQFIHLSIHSSLFPSSIHKSVHFTIVHIISSSIKQVKARLRSELSSLCCLLVPEIFLLLLMTGCIHRGPA